MSIPATVGNSVVLAMIIDGGVTGLFPQAEIYDGNSLEATIDLTDLGQGRYEGQWIPLSVGTYTTVFNVYQNNLHTVELTPLMVSREIEQIFVTSSSVDNLAESIARILGLMKENAFIDNTVYDVNSMLLSARVRIFNTKINAQAATDGGSETTGLIATYTMEATYEGSGRMKQYRMIKE
ncbi:MAG: hypothetical protein ACXAEU_19815 [Candidatus Hodarchaeales archaeon]|jgi:hypothetical protein